MSVNKPRGVMAYDTVANASYAWGKIGFVASGNAGGFAAPTASASPADCLIDLYYALKQQYRNGASWLMSDATMGKVRKFKDAEGNFIWAPPAGTADVPTILGKPVSTDDNMDAVAANKFPISFGNFKRGYLIIDRFGIRVLRDPYTNKPYVHFYTTKLITQANEKAALHLNFVNRKREIYASNITTQNRITQRQRNDELLSSTYILNEQGQRYSLKEISDLNVSNPKIRKDELLCRARGFEDLAKELGHEPYHRPHAV